MEGLSSILVYNKLITEKKTEEKEVIFFPRSTAQEVWHRPSLILDFINIMRMLNLKGFQVRKEERKRGIQNNYIILI
jgi:hypothetical protein